MNFMIKKRVLILLGVLFILINGVAYLHAYRFTHFNKANVERTGDPKELSRLEKIKILFAGVDNPKPINRKLPVGEFETVSIKSTVLLECWKLSATVSKGTVIMFHGFAGEKSSLLDRSDVFLKLGYNVLLVDFMGSGGSEGNETSIGYKEAEQVKDCFDYVVNSGEKNIVLFGTSMGAAAIFKAMDDYTLNASSIIIECPFGSLYKTVKARFKLMHVPSFPMASLLCFWGGVQNGYWAFSHNPAEYAKTISCPTLLLYGEADNRVSIEETESIFKNLKGEKVLKIYPNVGHEVFIHNQTNWKNDVAQFLSLEKLTFF